MGCHGCRGTTAAAMVHCVLSINMCVVHDLFNWPSTPQFGQPSKVAPAGRAPRAQWKKKELGNKG